MAGGFKPPYTPEKYAECDYVICNQLTKIFVTNIESKPGWGTDPDHATVFATFRIKFADKEQKNIKTKWKFSETPVAPKPKVTQKRFWRNLLKKQNR